MREIFRVLAIALVCLAFTGIVFGKSSSSITLTSPVNPSPYGSSVTFTATVTPIAVTGTVTFKDGSTTLGTGTISSGAATYITSKLTVASHSITASYGGNSLYDSSLSPTLTQTVSPASTTVTLTSFANPSSYGSSVTFTATVTPSTATGTVTFLDGSTTLGTGTISNGKATYSISALAVGTHSLTAFYGGDSNYNPSTSLAVTQTVNKASSSVALSSSANPSVYGASVTFTATVIPSAATGTVTFKDGSTTLGTGTISGGTATYGTSALAAKSHSITGAYGGDTNDSASTSPTLTQAVTPASTSVTLTSSANPSAYGSSVTFTATVTPTTATGKVTFADGGTTLGTGMLSNETVTYSTSALAVGSHSLTAAYVGDTTDRSSTSSVLTQTINPATTSVTLTSSANPSSYGSSVTFTATVTPSTATGTVTFLDGSTTLGAGTIGNGKAVYSTSTLAVGSHSITASYGGGARDTRTTSAALDRKSRRLNSSTVFFSSANPTAYQSSVTFAATVIPRSATGTVTFNDGNTLLGTGALNGATATYTAAALAVGSHSITASYGGDTDDNSSTSATLTQAVNPHRRGGPGDSKGILLPQIRRRARGGYFLHDPMLGAAWVGLFEGHAGSIAGKRSAETLKAAGIVPQLPDHRTIRFRLVAPRHRIPQKQAAEGGGRRPAQAAAFLEGDPAEADSRSRLAGDLRRAG